MKDRTGCAVVAHQMDFFVVQVVTCVSYCGYVQTTSCIYVK